MSVQRGARVSKVSNYVIDHCARHSCTTATKIATPPRRSSDNMPSKKGEEIMKRILVIALLLSIPCAAKKQPGDEDRKRFVSEFNKMLERDNRTAWADMQGKAHDVLQIALPNGSVSYMHEIEAAYVEPLKSEPYKGKMKALGFRIIELKTDVISESFPKGVWDIPLE
jgi:hypothetical protein